MAKMQSNVPTQKVLSGTLAGAVTTVVLWWLTSGDTGIDMPDEIKMSIQTIIFAVVGYFTPPSSRDQIVT